MELAALYAVIGMTYLCCAAVTYFFGWCVFHVSKIDRPIFLLVISFLWVIGFFYIVYKGKET